MYFAECAKTSVKNNLCSTPSIPIFKILTNGIRIKFSTMPNDVFLNGLIKCKYAVLPLKLLTVALKRYFAEYAKKYKKTAFLPVYKISFSRLQRNLIKSKFQRRQNTFFLMVFSTRTPRFH